MGEKKIPQGQGKNDKFTCFGSTDPRRTKNEAFFTSLKRK